jgi:hypothetical protein
MVDQCADGVYRTQPIETDREANGGGLEFPTSDDPQDAVRWNNWFQVSFQNNIRPVEESLTAGITRGIANEVMEMFDERVAPLERAVRELEMQNAELRGALDVLRTIGSGGINHRGAYDEGASYARGDAAMSGGSSFIAIRDHAGPCPGPDWRLLASAGKRGQRGERGPRGEAVKVKWATFDSAKLAMQLIMSDGSSSLVPLRAIFKNVCIDPEEFAIKFVLSDGQEISFSVRSLFECYDRQKSGR